MITHEVRGTVRGDMCIKLTAALQQTTGVFDLSEIVGYPVDQLHPNYGFVVEDVMLAGLGRSWAFSFGSDIAQAMIERVRFVEAWKESFAEDAKPSAAKKCGKRSWWSRRAR